MMPLTLKTIIFAYFKDSFKFNNRAKICVLEQFVLNNVIRQQSHTWVGPLFSIIHCNGNFRIVGLIFIRETGIKKMGKTGNVL